MPIGTSGRIFAWHVGSVVALPKYCAATPSRRGSSTPATAEAPSGERTRGLQGALKIGDHKAAPNAASENGDRKCQQTKADNLQSASSKRTLSLHPPPPVCCPRLRCNLITWPCHQSPVKFGEWRWGHAGDVSDKRSCGLAGIWRKL